MPLRYVVTGPPGAGKTSYVLARAELDDLVWDCDAIVAAIAAHRTRARGEHWPRHIIEAARAMREGLLAYVAGADLEQRAVFVIATNQQQAERIAAQIGAEIVQLGA